MKKILILPLLLFFAACSTDDTGLELTQKNEFTAGAQYKAAVASDCNIGINGSVYLDLINGIRNPIAVFSADIDGGTPGQDYRVTVEIQMLSDCEDIYSGSGSKTIFVMPEYAQAPFTQSFEVKVNGSLLPTNSCYRWRMTAEAVTGLKVKRSCVATTNWYDAPLF